MSNAVRLFHPPLLSCAHAPTARSGLAALAAACGVLLLLGGCATPAPGGAGGLKLPRYVAPSAGSPSARLLVRGAVQPGDRYAVLRHQDAEACKSPQVVSESAPQQPTQQAAIAVDVLTTLEFVIVRPVGVNSCMNLSFTPEAGHTYLMQGTQIGSGCSVQLLDATQPDRPRPLPDAVLRTAAGQRCMPLAQARAKAPRPAGASITGGQVNGEAVLNPNADTRDLQWLIRP